MNIARMGRLAGVACLALLPAAPQGADLDARTALPLSTFPRETIAVETRSARRHLFEAWRAETPAQREQGLMFIRSLGAGQAMIFVYDPPEHVAMWMKNTLLPLDMLFVDEQGCVIKVKENARPGSLDPIEAEGDVALVVELNGGVAAQRGIRAGDRVVRPAADWPRAAAGPCTVSR